MAYLGSPELMLMTCSDRACTGDASMDARLKLSFQGKLWQQAPKSRQASGRQRAEKASKTAPQATASSSSAASIASVEQGQSSSVSELTAVSSRLAHSSTGSVAVQQSQLQSASALARQMPIKPETEPKYNSSSPRDYSFMASAANGAAPAAAQEGSKSSATFGSSTLHANATVWASVRLGPPLNVVPGFLISYTGGLIATAVLQALMPSVLELLARDYATWAGGEQRAALLEPADPAVPTAELVHP